MLTENGTVATGIDERMQIALSEQKMLLERNVGVLGTLAATSPLVGLLGTVWGIMRAFNDMAQSGAAGPSVVAAGIAEALFTTAAGILIAVPAVVLHNHFARRMNTMLAVAENHGRSLRIAILEVRGRASRTSASHGPAPAEPEVVSKSVQSPEPTATR